MTYIHIREGWLYLAVVLDLATRKIIGWSMSEHMKAWLVCDALTMAYGKQNPDAGLFMHTDRDSPYARVDGMALPQNLSASAAPYLMDPLLNFKFLLLWDGNPVTGVRKIGEPTRKTEVVDFREGGAPQHARRISGPTTDEAIQLDRGLIIDPVF
jgi:hypothetical protein